MFFIYFYIKLDIPESVNSLRLLKIASRGAQITWKPPFDGNSQIKRFIVQYKEAQGKLNHKK